LNSTQQRDGWKLAQAIIEIVLAPALGLGLSWAAYRSNPFARLEGAVPVSPLDHVVFQGPVFLCGVSLVAGLGLAVEALSGRSPKRWGVGRWAWAIACFYTIAFLTLDILLSIPTGSDPFSLATSGRGAWEDLGPFLISLWITALFVGRPRDAGPDSREWCGRAFGLLILLQNAVEVFHSYWYSP
jgi:hypothetical protein